MTITAYLLVYALGYGGYIEAGRFHTMAQCVQAGEIATEEIKWISTRCYPVFEGTEAPLPEGMFQ